MEEKNIKLISKFIKQNASVLDLGCGDGLNTAITFGAKIRDNYDRYEKN